jgi:hypothetical protein
MRRATNLRGMNTSTLRHAIRRSLFVHSDARQPVRVWGGGWRYF